MGWIIGGFIVISIGALAAWFFVPTLRLIGRPDFEPAPKDDASVQNALNRPGESGGWV